MSVVSVRMNSRICECKQQSNNTISTITLHHTTNNINTIKISSPYKMAEIDNIRERVIVLVRDFLDFRFLWFTLINYLSVI